MKFILTVNPHGGTKQGPLLLQKVKPIFDAAGADLFIIDTTFSGHAQELANQLNLSAYDGFIGIGGDGTLHEITNGMLSRYDGNKIPIGIIPGGSGNSYMHDLQLTDPLKAAKAIINGKTRALDTTKVEVNHIIKYSNNMIGWGLVTDVGNKAEHFRWLGTNRYTILSVVEVLRAQNKGAVGYIGGSNVTYWNEDFWWGVGNGNITSNPSYNSTGPGAYDCTFHDNGEDNWAVANSTLMVAGNLGVVEAGGSLVNYYWEIYHLMGDPSLSTYFGVPSENNLTHTEFLPVGSTSISISGEPYTYVGITHNGSLLGAGQIGPFGNIELSLSGATIPGTAQIVGTCQNHKPYFGEILIASPEGPYVMVESSSFTSGYGSNDEDEIIQFGETVSLSLNLENVGNDDAAGVEVNLSIDDPYINITMGSITVFSLASDNSYNTEGFEFEVSANIPNEYDFEISCTIAANGETWESSLNFTAYAPVIEVSSVIGSLDPGVSSNLEVHLLNTGGADIHSPMVSIVGDSYITVNESSFTNAYVWDNGDEINNEEILTLSVSVSSATPIGHIAEFTVTVNSNQPPTTDYEENITFTIPVGQVIANFEAGLGSLDWSLSCSGLGCANWDIDNSESYTGSSSAQSGNIGNSQSSDMSITLDITADGEIDFYYRVSAEYSSSGSYFYDGLEFYIDNTLKGQYQTTTGGGSPWTQVSYDVTEGEHTFRWSYVKDGGGGSTDCDNTDCDDAAWVDDITFPPAYIESDGVLGDLNGDGTINILDVIIMVNIILGVEPESALADVNGDGVVNILDIVQEINLILTP